MGPALEKLLFAPQSAPAAAGPLVAVVDDDDGVRGSLDSLLRSFGMACALFASGEDLLSSPLLDRVSCLVTDLHMPGMSGIELQAEMARSHPGTGVIVMTAYPGEAARHQALEAGALAFLAKPVDPDVLLAAIGARG